MATTPVNHTRYLKDMDNYADELEKINDVFLTHIGDMKSQFHVSIQEYEATSRHYVVANDEGRLEVIHPDHVSELTGIQCNQKVSLVVHPGNANNFDAEMIAAQYAERVAVGSIGPDPQPLTSCSSVFELNTPQRVKTTLELGPGLKPVGYRDRVVCYTKCSKKRFCSTVHYQPKYKPTGYAETRYVLPQRAETKYVSMLDYGDGGPAQARRWYTSAVTMLPKTYSHNSVHNFQMLSTEEQEVETELSESEDEASTASVVSDDLQRSTNIELDNYNDYNRNLMMNGDWVQIEDVMMNKMKLTDDNENYHNVQEGERDSGYNGGGLPSFGVTNGYVLSEEDEHCIDEM